MKRFTLILFCVLPCLCFGESFSVEGITYEITSDKEVSLSKVDATFEGICYVPSSVSENNNDYTVSNIATFAFSDCDKITQIFIPNTVNVIEKGAFKNCASLEYLEICDGTTELEFKEDTFDSPFSGTSLVNFYVGRNLTSGSRPWDSYEFTRLILGPSITSLPYQAFLYPKFSEIELKYSEKQLVVGYSKVNKVGMFENCTTLKKAYVDRIQNFSDRTSKGRSLFYYVPNLEYLEVGDNLTYVQSELATNCRKLTKVQLPETITHIYDDAFAFSYLTDINLPNGLQYIGSGAFTSARFESIEVPNTVTEMGKQPFWQAELKSATIPGSIKSLPYGTFANCSSLQQVSLGEGIEDLNEMMFNCCYQLRDLTLPSSVKTIGDDFINLCSKFETLTCLAVTPPTITSETFSTDQYSKVIIEVPAASVDEYKSAPYWKYFSNITPINSSSVANISSHSKSIIATYDVMGNIIENPSCGIYIIKYSDGSTTKVIYK